jgi:hypothetical protein
MHHFIDSGEDIIAVSITGKITGADLDAILDRLDARFAWADKVNVYVETHHIEGIEIASLPRYVARALPLLGKLTAFGRVAVVADQSWIRAGTRIESAIIPFIAYRVFMPEDSEEALAWVEGREQSAMA